MGPIFEKMKPEFEFQAIVIVMNYNGRQWLKQCWDSIKNQTIFKTLEVIVADNNFPNGSRQLAEELMSGWDNGRVLNHGSNLPTHQARGGYLFFLNNDAWLGPDFLETL